MKSLSKGLDHLLATIDEQVEHMFDDAEEIGTSDISCCVTNVLRSYYDDPKEATDVEFNAIRGGVRWSIGELKNTGR